MKLFALIMRYTYVLFFFDAQAVLFAVCVLGASSYETRRTNDTASVLVPDTLWKGLLMGELRRGSFLFFLTMKLLLFRLLVYYM